MFCKGAGPTPYELMFGYRLNIHHIRSFESLIFCHVPTSKRKRLDMNCRLGYLLGYRENVVGCYVYFPSERTKGFASDVKINETIKFCDRHASEHSAYLQLWFQSCSPSFGEGSSHESLASSAVRTASDTVDLSGPVLSLTSARNMDMCSVASALPSLTSQDEALWHDMVRNSKCQYYDTEVAMSTSQEGGSAGHIVPKTLQEEEEHAIINPNEIIGNDIIGKFHGDTDSLHGNLDVTIPFVHMLGTMLTPSLTRTRSVIP